MVKWVLFQKKFCRRRCSSHLQPACGVVARRLLGLRRVLLVNRIDCPQGSFAVDVCSFRRDDDAKKIADQTGCVRHHPAGWPPVRILFIWSVLFRLLGERVSWAMTLACFAAYCRMIWGSSSQIHRSVAERPTRPLYTNSIDML